MKSKQRWSLYGIAALATAGAMAWVDRPADGLLPPVAASSARAVPAAPPAKREAGAGWVLPQRQVTDSALDPFQRDEAPEAGAATLAAVSRVQAAPPPAPVPPPLPYSYVGQWVEKGVTVAFLTTPQGLNVAARVGATLDGSYRVDAIDSEGIAFSYLPLKLKQRLNFADADRAVATAATPPQAPAAPETEETN